MNEVKNMQKVMFDFEKTKSNFVSSAISDSSFAEDKDGEVRRPIVVYSDRRHKERWMRRHKRIDELQETIKEGLPNLFPENSSIYLRPKHIEGVTSVQVYNNTVATNSRIVKRDVIVRRLSEMLTEIETSLQTDETEELLQKRARVAEQIKYFENTSTEDFRLRSSGKSDVTAFITIANHPPRTERVTESGLFLSPAFGYYGKVRVSPPEAKSQHHQKDRLTVYDYVSPIPCELYKGKLFDEMEAAKYREALKEKSDHGLGKIR